MTTNKMVDFHSHILPGADHGSTGLEESRKQLAEVIRGSTGAAALRGRINTAASIAEIREILADASLLGE